MARSAPLWLGLFWALLHATWLQAEDVGLRVPEHFEVTLYAGDELAHDIFSLTIDSRGRVVVAGVGYVKTLHDTDGDGRADEATLFSSVPKGGAHGLIFDGDDLICTGDNHVMRLRDANGDGVADGKPEIWTTLLDRGHATNGIVRGPDGWFYVICGNDADVSRQHATTAASPVQSPQLGGVVRFSPDGKQSEVVAHGFRNPYDLDFNAYGNLFTVDADGERDQYLPWYSPTRLFDITQGMHHGWLLRGWRRSWNRPASFFDNVQRLVEVGRGSPTGVIVYRHRQFPDHYRGSVFSLCWTLGRVYHFPLKRDGASYQGRRETFMETTGEVGFAPVDLAVDPAGDLFVAVGGRGTRGSVFRVRYTGPIDDAPHGAVENPLLEILSALQPLSAWSRVRWMPGAKSLGRQPFESAAAGGQFTTQQRIRAVEVLVELFGGVSIETAEKIVALNDAELTARVAWAMSRRPQGAPGRELLARLTHESDPRIARAAWEGLAALPPGTATKQPANWSDMSNRRNRRVRAASLLARSRQAGTNAERPPATTSARRLAKLWQRVNQKLGFSDFDEAARVFNETDNVAMRQEAVRLMQIALGDIRVEPTEPKVYAGYVAIGPVDSRIEPRWGPLLASAFPTSDVDLDRELARLLGMLSVDGDQLPEKMAGRWSDTSRVQDDIHYLIVMSRLPGRRTAEVTQRTATALARLHAKMQRGRMYASRNWPLRVGETFQQLVARDPQLPAALVDHPAFGLPAHSLFAMQMPPGERRAAARKLIHAAREADDEEAGFTAELVEVATALPVEEYLPMLRDQWDDLALRDPIAIVLARQPRPVDRQRFVTALRSAEPSVVERVSEALASLGGEGSADEILTAMAALRQYCAAEQYTSVRQALVRLLIEWTGKEILVSETGGDNLLVDYGPWFDWFAAAHPRLSEKLTGLAGADADEWRRRLARIPWDEGDTIRGKRVYEQRSCYRCHGARDRLGPDLAGVAGRFSRDDLFVAIIDPNKSVSPLYQTTQVITGSGRIYQGALIYESPEGTLLQTGPDVTVRVAGEEIIAMRKSRQSVMPVGLLNDITDRDLADLYAYLTTLRGGN